MIFERLLENPEKYRCGENYRATNIVFPVEFDGKKYVIKKQGILSSLANFYYALQDGFFYQTRGVGTCFERLKREANCLEKLAGCGAPGILAHNENTIVREYIDGVSFRNLSGPIRERALEEGFNSLQAIHQEGVVIGDAHVKNILLSSESNAYWMDFDGYFNDQERITTLKAMDVLKFVYSTYSETRDEKITTFATEIARSYNELSEVQDLVKYDLSALRLWFPTRIPLNGRLNKRIKEILLR